MEADLADRGVGAHFSGPVAARLVARFGESEGDEYEAALDAIVVAYEVHRGSSDALEDDARNIDEIQRLMQGFAGELRKLEEGLRVVSAYVLRMHKKATKDRGELLH